MSINTNHSNIQFEKEFLSIKKWIKKQVPGICGYSSAIVQARLMQYLVTVSLPVYAETTYALVGKTMDPFPFKDRVLDFGGGTVDLDTGCVSMNLRQWMKNTFYFITHWSFCLISIVFSYNKSSTYTNVKLVYGVGDEAMFDNGSDQRFLDYIKHGPIKILDGSNHLLVESSFDGQSSSTSKVTYCKKPLISLLGMVKLSFLDRNLLLLSHILLFFSYFFAIIRLPQLSLLGRDFAYSSIFTTLDKKNLISSVIQTCSNYTEQPVWMRGSTYAKIHMIWYAQAWKSIIYKSDYLESVRPNLRWIRVDTHWVWTNSFSNYLKALGLSDDIKVVGPIVWQLPELTSPKSDKLKIGVFDSSPFSDDIALKHGQITNYHHPSKLFSFIRGIVSLKDSLENNFKRPVTYSFKTKRGHTKLYDKDYFDYLGVLYKACVIDLVDPRVNIYYLISSCHIVIAYPFTSVAYVAESLNIPCVYYDPTDSICDHNFGEKSTGIYFANNLNSLKSVILKVLKKKQKTMGLENNV